MKKRIISGIKIYLCCIAYILVTVFVYSFYLIKTHSNSNNIVELILGITAFILLGLLYANMIHKKGLIIGLLVGALHLLLINFIYFLSTGNFDIKPLPFIIYIISSGLGGILGISFKKIV